MGRPTIRTDENREIVLDTIRRGGSLVIAADIIGCSDRALRLWLSEDSVFSASFTRERGNRMLNAVEKLSEAGADSNDVKWYAARMYPLQYADQGSIRRALKELIEDEPEVGKRVVEKLSEESAPTKEQDS